MTTTNTVTADYLPGEALTGLMTAREWTTRFWPGLFQCMADEDRHFEEVTQHGHDEAARLGLPISLTGEYPPIVWELEATRNT